MVRSFRWNEVYVLVIVDLIQPDPTCAQAPTGVQRVPNARHVNIYKPNHNWSFFVSRRGKIMILWRLLQVCTSAKTRGYYCWRNFVTRGIDSSGVLAEEIYMSRYKHRLSRTINIKHTHLHPAVGRELVVSSRFKLKDDKASKSHLQFVYP